MAAGVLCGRHGHRAGAGRELALRRGRHALDAADGAHGHRAAAPADDWGYGARGGPLVGRGKKASSSQRADECRRNVNYNGKPELNAPSEEEFLRYV